MRTEKYDCCLDITETLIQYISGDLLIRYDATVYSIPSLSVFDKDDIMYYSKRPLLFHINGTKATEISLDINNVLNKNVYK